MEPKVSATKDILIQTEDFDQAVHYYENVLGLEVVERTKNLVGFSTGWYTLYIDRGKALGPVLEFIVSDLEKTKAMMMREGATVVLWEDTGVRHYLRDRFGLTFNLIELG